MIYYRFYEKLLKMNQNKLVILGYYLLLLWVLEKVLKVTSLYSKLTVLK
jgi:hypothetical protein